MLVFLNGHISLTAVLKAYFPKLFQQISEPKGEQFKQTANTLPAHWTITGQKYHRSKNVQCHWSPINLTLYETRAENGCNGELKEWLEVEKNMEQTGVYAPALYPRVFFKDPGNVLLKA